MVGDRQATTWAGGQAILHISILYRAEELGGEKVGLEKRGTLSLYFHREGIDGIAIRGVRWEGGNSPRLAVSQAGHFQNR